MERDLKFEVQYLLSLTLVIFGLLSVEKISESVNIWIGIAVIVFLSIYFSVFTVFYAFDQSPHFRIDFLDKLSRFVNKILMLISIAFVYFIGHAVFSITYHNLPPGMKPANITWQTVINFGLPILPIAVMVGVFKMYVADPHNRYEEVKVKVIPNSIRVFPSKDQTQPLTIKVENGSDREISWNLSIDIPSEITFHEEGREHTGDFHESGSLTPKRAFRKNFELSHAATERLSELVEVIIDFEDASHQEDVEIQLET